MFPWRHRAYGAPERTGLFSQSPLTLLSRSSKSSGLLSLAQPRSRWAKPFQDAITNDSLVETPFPSVRSFKDEFSACTWNAVPPFRTRPPRQRLCVIARAHTCWAPIPIFLRDTWMSPPAQRKPVPGQILSLQRFSLFFPGSSRCGFVRSPFPFPRGLTPPKLLFHSSSGELRLFHKRFDNPNRARQFPHSVWCVRRMFCSFFSIPLRSGLPRLFDPICSIFVVPFPGGSYATGCAIRPPFTRDVDTRFIPFTPPPPLFSGPKASAPATIWFRAS